MRHEPPPLNYRVQGTFNSGTPGPLIAQRCFGCSFRRAARAQPIPPLDVARRFLINQPLAYNSDRKELRRQLRARRRNLPSSAQSRAAGNVARLLGSTQNFRQAQTLALYLANDGEIDPYILARRALRQGKTCYLPVLDKRYPLMHFARWRPGDPLLRNRYGIPEPLPRAPRIAPEELDMVCLPLVGFDAQGNRLGMGGGFYDRTFAWRRSAIFSKGRNKGPLLVGVAHQCQQVEALPLQPWDVPLDMVVTDETIYLRDGKRVREKRNRKNSKEKK